MLIIFTLYELYNITSLLWKICMYISFQIFVLVICLLVALPLITQNSLKYYPGLKPQLLVLSMIL